LSTQFPAPLFATNATFGSANVNSEPGKTVRLLPSVFGGTDGTSAVWIAAIKLDAKVTKGGVPRDDRWLNYYGPHQLDHRHGKGNQIFEFTEFSKFLTFDESEVRSVCRDKLVFIGQGIGEDTFRNPVDGRSIPGVEVLATAVLNLANETWLERAPVQWQISIIIGWGIALACYVSWKRSLRRHLTAVVAALGLGAASVMALDMRVWWWWLIPMLQTPAAILVAAVPRGCVAFISYRSSDGSKEAGWLQECVEARGRRAYLAPGEIKPGAQFLPELLGHIRRAPIFYFVASPQAVEQLKQEGSWINQEVSLALEHRRLILVVRQEGTAPLSQKELPLNVRELAGIESRQLDIGVHHKYLYNEICPF
jgi:hypothetical protein